MEVSVINKRLRKKLHRGEFRELGFEVRIILEGGVSEERFDIFLDYLIGFVEAHNLGIGGGGDAERVEYVVGVLEGRGSVTPEQREALLAWLAAREEVRQVEGSQLFDLHYPPKTIP